MNKDLELELEMEQAGYELLIVSPKDKKSYKEMLSLYLNEKNNDFKVYLIKENKNNSKVIEWTIEETKNSLEKEHPINQVIVQLEKTKEKNLGLKDIEFKPRKMKIN